MEKDLMELVNECGVAEAADTGKVKAARDMSKMLQFLGFKAASDKIKKRVDPIVKKAQLAAGGYIEITPAKIQAFLDRKAAEYNKEQTRKISKRINGAEQSIAAMSAAHIASMYGELTSALMSQNNIGGLAAQQMAANQQSINTANSMWGNVDWGNSSAIQTTGTNVVFSGIGQYLSDSSRPTETLNARTVDFSSSKSGTIGRFEWKEVDVENYEGIPPANVLETFKNIKGKKAFDYYTVASVNAVPDPLLLGRIDNSTSRFFIAQWGNDVSLDDVI